MAIAEIAIPGDHSTAATYHRPQWQSTTLSADSATWWSRAGSCRRPPALFHRLRWASCTAGKCRHTHWCRAQGALLGRIKLAPTCTHWPLQYMASARFAVHTLAGGGKKVKGLRGGAVVEHLSCPSCRHTGAAFNTWQPAPWIIPV